MRFEHGVWLVGCAAAGGRPTLRDYETDAAGLTRSEIPAPSSVLAGNRVLGSSGARGRRAPRGDLREDARIRPTAARMGRPLRPGDGLARGPGVRLRRDARV